MLSRWLYRSSQFFTALRGKVNKQEVAQAEKLLGPELYKVFRAMPGPYIGHALTVMRRVRESGCDDPIIQQAALLHDTGKYDPENGIYVTLAHRVVVVLLEAVPAGRNILARLSSHKEGVGIKGRVLYPFYMAKHHAKLGAERAAKSGASPEVVKLIAQHHHRTKQNKRLIALQRADDSS